MSAAKRSRIESQWEAAGGYFYFLNQPSCWTFPNCNKTDCLPARPLNLPHGKCRPWSFSVHFGSSAFVNGISQPSIQPRTHRDLARYRTSTQGRLPLDQIFQESLDHIFFFISIPKRKLSAWCSVILLASHRCPANSSTVVSAARRRSEKTSPGYHGRHGVACSKQGPHDILGCHRVLIPDDKGRHCRS